MRNDAMESLIFTFRRILSEKNISTNCLLTGPPGSGKTDKEIKEHDKEKTELINFMIKVKKELK